MYANSFLFNMTMTSAPVVQNNLIKLYMNGLFDVPEGSAATYNNLNTEWPERFAHAHSE